MLSLLRPGFNPWSGNRDATSNHCMLGRKQPTNQNNKDTPPSICDVGFQMKVRELKTVLSKGKGNENGSQTFLRKPGAGPRRLPLLAHGPETTYAALSASLLRWPDGLIFLSLLFVPRLVWSPTGLPVRRGGSLRQVGVPAPERLTHPSKERELEGIKHFQTQNKTIWTVSPRGESGCCNGMKGELFDYVKQRRSFPLSSWPWITRGGSSSYLLNGCIFTEKKKRKKKGLGE